MRNRLPLFYATSVLLWIALYAYIPYVAPYGEELGANHGLIGMIAGAYGFTQMLLRFPLGILSDKLRMRKNFIIIGLFIAAISGFIVYIFPSPTSLLAARGLAGIAVSSWVIFLILGASYFRNDETVKSSGYLNATNALGRTFALLLGGIMAERFGFSHAFLLSGIVAVIGLVLSFGIVEKKPEILKDPPRIRELLNVVRNHQLLSASVLAVIVQYIPFATTFAFTPVIAIRLGANNMQLGWLGLISVLPGLFVSPLAGTILPKKLGIKHTLVISFIIAGVACIAVPFCQTLWQLFLVRMIGNAGTAASLTLLMGLCIQDIPTEHRATAMGFFQAVYGGGMFLGPFVMGWISHGFGLAPAFIFTGVLGIIGAVLSVVFINKGFLRYTQG